MGDKHGSRFINIPGQSNQHIMMIRIHLLHLAHIYGGRDCFLNGLLHLLGTGGPQHHKRRQNR